MPPRRALGSSPKRIIVRVSDEMYSWLESKADEYDTSVSSLIRRLIREAMRREGFSPHLTRQREARGDEHAEDEVKEEGS